MDMILFIISRLNAYVDITMLLLWVIICVPLLPTKALNFIDIPSNSDKLQPEKSHVKIKISEPNIQRRYKSKNSENSDHIENRRSWPYNAYRQGHENDSITEISSAIKDKYHYENDKDDDLKVKISTLVLQTMHDTDRRLKSVDSLRQKYHDNPPYKIGFILSLIKKSRDIMNELFNVAIKHREKWKALEDLKIFELIVHTNVDTTNLVRQLVGYHVEFLNMSSADENQKRVVLL